MAIGRNDNYVQWTFTVDTFRKRQKRENSTVGPCFEKPARSVPETTTNTCKPQLAGFGFHVLTRRKAPFGPGFMS